MVVGFLERSAEDLPRNALVIATDADGRIVSRASVGLQGYYVLFLPAGEHSLLALVDRDENGVIQAHEAAGEAVSRIAIPKDGSLSYFGLNIEMGAGSYRLGPPVVKALGDGIELDNGIPTAHRAEGLSSEIFGEDIISLGVSDYAQFFSYVSPIVYLNELDLSIGKVPAIFVHGMKDSPQIFEKMQGLLPTERFSSLFFYYPTGARLPALSRLLHHLFLSGKVLPSTPQSMIIAHSMGGLIAREAINHIGRRPAETAVTFFGSFVSPYGGVSDAGAGVKFSPIVVPAWIDLAPKSRFLSGLFLPLPEETVFAMITADADGVIDAASQRHEEALAQATEQQAFQESHVGIMSNEVALGTMLTWSEQQLDPVGANGPSTSEPSDKQDPDSKFDDAEKRVRAYSLRQALIASLKRTELSTHISLITPTVVRFKAQSADASTVVQLSTGIRIRLDAPDQNEPLFVQPWPKDEPGVEAIADTITGLIQARLAHSNH